MARQRFTVGGVLVAVILLFLGALSAQAQGPYNVCTTVVSGDQAGSSATDYLDAYDVDLNSFLETGYNDWQYIQVDFNCVGTFFGLNRYMSYDGVHPFDATGVRGKNTPDQGERVAYSVDGNTWTDLTAATTHGWEAYVNYAPNAWHSLPYGGSRHIRLDTPAQARFVRFYWDGDDDTLNDLLVEFSPPGTTQLPSDCYTFTGEEAWSTRFGSPRRADASTLQGVYDMVAQEGTIWMVGSLGKMVSSEDYGETWTSQYESSVNGIPTILEGITVVRRTAFEPPLVVAVGYVEDPSYRSVVVRYDGSTWSTIDTGVPGTLDAVSAGSRTDLWAVGGNNLILFSDDAGLTWTRQNLPAGFPSAIHFNDVVALSATEAWVVGNHYVLHTTDGGQTWVEQQTGVDGSYYALAASRSFVNGGYGTDIWIVGVTFPVDYPMRGVIAHFDGTQWTNQQFNDVWINDIDLVYNGGVWAVGTKGTLLYYDSSLTGWIQIPSGTERNLSLIAGTGFIIPRSSIDLWVNQSILQPSTILHYRCR